MELGMVRANKSGQMVPDTKDNGVLAKLTGKANFTTQTVMFMKVIG